MADTNVATLVEEKNANTSNASNTDPKDEFGRTASERTVELSTAAAESVNREVTAGKHDTYDDALAYIIERGLLEIKRVREQQEKMRDAKRIQAEAKTWQNLLQLNPALVTQPEVMAKMIAALAPKR